MPPFARVNFAPFFTRTVHLRPALSVKIYPAPPFHEGLAMSFRRDFITKPIFSWAQGVLPTMSETEREALEAGDVWWDADLFTGHPDWSKLLAYPQAALTDEERAFLNGPVDELCRMLDEWKINWEWRDLPHEAWDFIKAKKFFGMIIPKEFGGRGFSPYSHSEGGRQLSTRSLAAPVPR